MSVSSFEVELNKTSSRRDDVRGDDKIARENEQEGNVKNDGVIKTTKDV